MQNSLALIFVTFIFSLPFDITFFIQPLEERLQNEHEKGTLILLQNLDPEYTSGEVQVMIIPNVQDSSLYKYVYFCGPFSNLKLIRN